MGDATRRGGFTLVEMLAVIAILAIAMGMITYIPTQDKREGAVQAAAEELAATLRSARALAIDKRCSMGVTFNVENGPNTSGKQINNWAGEHWYRIVGPSFADYQNTDDQLKTFFYGGIPTPLFYWQGLGRYLNKIDSCWIGDRHVLKAHAVRFLAVSDQDTGKSPNTSPSYASTYPRPWFGYWDPTSHRLYPWGGYDHAIANSGFCFEGGDGQITGCLNGSDRLASDGTPVFKTGKVRSLLNGRWLDYYLRFNPDGTVEERCMEARIDSISNNGAKLGDLFSGNTKSYPLTSFMPFTGWYSISLAPDLDNDDDSYPSAQQAMASMWPVYRVQVSPLGTIRVIRVRNSPPSGSTYALDATITNWQSSGQVQANYVKSLAYTSSGSPRSVTPASDFITPQMLSGHQWWMTVSP